jgi:ubiquitin carboxyl-terminal hydrolase L3
MTDTTPTTTTETTPTTTESGSTTSTTTESTSTTTSGDKEKVETKDLKWGPMESNPDVLTTLAHKLGATKNWRFNDILGLDEELLAMTPAPVLAVIFLYPWIGQTAEPTTTTTTDKPTEKPTEDKDKEKAADAFYLTQVGSLGNACGTVATIHALANLTLQSKYKSKLGDGALKDFIEKTSTLTPLERGRYMAKDKGINDVHQSFFAGGSNEKIAQTAAPKAGAEHEDVDYHFIAFVERDGKLLELDGLSKAGPLEVPGYKPLSDPSSDLFHMLKAVAKRIQAKWVSKNPDEIRFSLIALTDES